MQPPTIMFGSDGQNSKAKMSSGHSSTNCSQSIQTQKHSISKIFLRQNTGLHEKCNAVFLIFLEYNQAPWQKTHSIFCQVGPSCTSTCLRITGVREAEEENDGRFIERCGFLYPGIFFLRQSHSDHTLRTGEEKKESSNVIVNDKLLDVIERPPRNILKLRIMGWGGGGAVFKVFSIRLYAWH